MRVSDHYSKKDAHCDKHINVYSVEGKITWKTNEVMLRCMKGELDPKTVKELCGNDKRDVSSAQPRILLHNSSAGRDKINGISLLESR